jgi:hypothetical protein
MDSHRPRLTYGRVASGNTNERGRNLTARARQRIGGADGVSLVAVLLVVVILGALSATAIVGLRSTPGSGGTNGGVLANATAAGNVANRISGSASPGVEALRPGVACNATADAARSASNVYVTNSGGKYPMTWSDLTSGRPPIYTLPTNVTINATNAKDLDGPGWKLVMSGGGSVSANFVCG